MNHPRPPRVRAAAIAAVLLALTVVAPPTVRAAAEVPRRSRVKATAPTTRRPATAGAKAKARAARVLTPTAARAAAEKVITAASLRQYLTFLASDALQGRDTPSPGLDAAAEFLAFHLARFGLRPLGNDGTYFQRIPLRHVLPDEEMSRLTLVGVGGGATARYGDDFLPTLGARRGGAGTVAESPLVYVGHGWVMPSRKIDAYKGVDVRGKVLVVTGRGYPRGVDGPNRDEDTADWRGPAAYAAANGARGIVYLGTDEESDGAYGALLRSVRAGRGEISPTDPAITDGVIPEPAADAVPAVTLSPEAARRLFDGEPLSGDDLLTESRRGTGRAAFDLKPEKRVAFTTAYVRETRTTQNVVAALDGADPALREQYVAFGAHYDHLGVAAAPDKNGDRIYNGADDDASGTSALLALAEAFSRAEARPRRSLLFVWHCGEEKGLWGSAFYTARPAVPLSRMVAQLNLDMIGRSRPAGSTNRRDRALSGPEEIYVIGSKAMSTTLGRVSESVNKGYLNLKFDYRYDDPDDPNLFFYRSDHFNYARRGVPIIFYFDGEHVDYHERSDEASRIDFEKMVKVTRTVFLTAAALADLPEPPRVDKKLPFRVE